MEDHKIYRFGESRLKSPQPSPNPPPGPIPPTLQTPGMILQQQQNQQQSQNQPQPNQANAGKMNGFIGKPVNQGNKFFEQNLRKTIEICKNKKMSIDYSKPQFFHV